MIQRKRLSLALWSALAGITPFAAFAEEQKEGHGRRAKRPSNALFGDARRFGWQCPTHRRQEYDLAGELSRTLDKLRGEVSYEYEANGACWNSAPKSACAEPLPCCIHLQLKMPQPFVQAVGKLCE